MITNRQSRAARALLGWTQKDLSVAAGCSYSTIADFERGAQTPHKSTMNNILIAFNEGGCTFVPNGVRQIPAEGKDAEIKPVPRCSGCRTTKNLREDLGSCGPWRCDSPNCVVF